MDEKGIARLLKEIISDELKIIRAEMATKDDLKAFATKDDVNAIRAEMAKKEDLKVFATKDDVNAMRAEMATKEDFKAFATKEDLKNFATKEDFLEFEARLSSTVERIREGIRLSLFEIEKELAEIKGKLRFYDFDYFSRQNDALLKLLKDLYEEKTFIVARVKDHENRLEAIEYKLGS
ncbi:MAG: hypothetical protein Kow00102_05870 [Spirochaetota bacterium]